MEDNNGSKLWIVKDYKSYSDDGARHVPDPEKYQVAAWKPEMTGVPEGSFKEFLGLAYEHQGEIAGVYALPIAGNPEINGLVKKLMTFVDATVADKEQKEATKKLITRTVWDHFNEISSDLERALKYATVVDKIR